ncbi:P-loop ATPase, Sll1717 family [Thiomicrolovo sp. ZZH C-3]
MTTINKLVAPSIDAVDYNVKSKKQFFQKAYLSTEFLEKACEENCYYLIGEKGSGKTALAYHIQNTAPKNIGAKVISISETQYKRFIKLKEDGKLSYTDYSIIWRATLLYLISKLILNKRKKWHHNLTNKFKPIEDAIQQYDSSSQIPELEYVIEFATTLTSDSELSTAIPEIVKVGIAEHGSQTSKTTQTKIKSALLECEGFLKTGLQSLRLKDDIAIFIDGLDAKPNGIEHSEYKNCLIGLSEAAWHLNSEFFPNIRDTQGRMRAVLLLRPDVFDSLNMHNSNCKLSDNSVLFHWHTTSDRFKESNLFKMSDKYFLSQNENTHGWNHYFSEKEDRFKSFPILLTNSFQRPRDVFSAVKILIDIYKRAGKGNGNQFARNSMNSSEFTDNFSEYLLGEAKNYSNYYITNKDFEIYINFFQYLDGARNFNYQTFIEAFENFKADPRIKELEDPSYLETPEGLLQFWYDINLIGFSESPEDGTGDFFHWAYRERSHAKIMPKVKVNCNYDVHPGIAKALNIGKKFKKIRKS